MPEKRFIGVKEKITKYSLARYVKNFRTVQVVSIKNGKPIFVLKDLCRNCRIYGHNLNMRGDEKVIIHKDKFLWSKKAKVTTYGFWTNGKRGESKLISDEPSGNIAYLDKYLKYPSREFSIENVLDEETKINGIKPVRAFFKKYGAMPEKRGLTKKKYEKIRKERDRVINKAFDRISKIKPIRKNLPLRKIKEEVRLYALKRKYSNNPDDRRAEERIFDVSDDVIRRALKGRIKK